MVRDMSGRIQIMELRSTIREMSGSAATAGRNSSGPSAAGTGALRGAGPVLRYYHDSMILKFTQDGKFLMNIGKAGQSKGSNDTENLGLPAKIFVDPKTNEVYVADGYGNKRVIVFDGDTGKFKRYWGAYGKKPDDTNIGRYDPGWASRSTVPESGALRRPSNDGTFMYATA